MNEHLTKGEASIALADNVTLPLEIITATVAVLANRGGGKSAVAHRLVELMYEAGLPVVVIDVKGDWWGIRSSADGKGAGLPFVIFGGDHGDVPLEPTAGELLADLIVDDRVPAVLDLSHMSKTNARSFATAFAERLYRRNRDPLHVVIEEADVLVPQRASADTARLLGAMEDLAKRGRHRGIGLTVVSQRAQEVAKSVLDLMETVVLLRMTGPRSIKAVQDWINVNANQDESTVRTVIASLPTLATGEGWVWSPGFLRLLERVAFPMFSTFDSHATPTPGQARVIPKARADIDLDQLGAEIAATRERARDNDPRALRDEIRALREKASAGSSRVEEISRQLVAKDALLAQRDREVCELQDRIAVLESRKLIDGEAVERSLRSAIEDITAVLGTVAPGTVAVRSMPADGGPEPPARSAPERCGAPFVPTGSGGGDTAPAGDPTRFRAGAQRMINALARMAPLRLTKAQWATVARMKHTGGTWSTYLGELRRAGLIEEDTSGFSLTEAGWDYVGRRPDPMTAEELQQHYLGILRAGAARMLTAVMSAYPDGLTKERIAELSEVTVTGGTFSTYLGELRRNGLVEPRGDLYLATDVLMRGAAG